MALTRLSWGVGWPQGSLGLWICGHVCPGRVETPASFPTLGSSVWPAPDSVPSPTTQSAWADGGGEPVALPAASGAHARPPPTPIPILLITDHVNSGPAWQI